MSETPFSDMPEPAQPPVRSTDQPAKQAPFVGPEVVAPATPPASPPAAPAKPAPASTSTGAPTPPKPKDTKKTLLLVLLVIGVLVAVGLLVAGVVLMFNQNNHKKKPAPAPVAVDSYCYIRVLHLICVDKQGASAKRYDLPQVTNSSITKLVPSYDKKSYVATVSDSNFVKTYWILDSSFKPVKQISSPDGTMNDDFSWSHDNKSLFVDVSPPANVNKPAQQIYKYDVASSTFTKLTSSRLNTQPYELADGKLIYLSWAGGAPVDGLTYIPYVMNADGSDAQPYAKSVVTSTFVGMNYDGANDRVFVLNSDGQITYFTAGASSQTKQLKADALTAFDAVSAFYDGSIVVQRGIQAKVYDLATGTSAITLTPFDSTVGVIAPTSLTVSSQQKEQGSERIINLAAAADDFKDFLTANFPENTTCSSPTTEVSWIFRGLTRDQFAKVTENNCGQTTDSFYIKNNGTWSKVFTATDAPTCAQVTQYKFTKELVASCYNDKKQLITNTNQ